MSIFDIDDNINVKIDRDVNSIDRFEKAMLTCVIPGTVKCVGAAPDFADRLRSTLKKAKLSLVPHKSRKVIAKDCRGLKKGDALGWIREISKDDKDAIVVLENITQIPEGDPALYDPKQYVESILVRSWKNNNIYIDDYHIDRRNLTVILTCPPEDEEQLRAICSICSYAWVGDIEEKIENLMSEKKGIVLNRMYTGRYLSKNLGHEVINMFADDEGDRYLYLNATGDFSAEHVGNIGSMLLIKYAGQDKDGKPWVEVLGCATGLKDIYNPKQRKQSEKDCVPSKGNSFKRIKDIKYGGVPIHYIFDGSEQQDVLISYYAEKLLVPKNDVKIYLSFAPFGDHTTQTSRISSDSGRYVVEMVEKFASTSLKRYILEKDNKEDFDSLNKLMSLDIWTEAESEKITIHKSFKPHQISLFDIMPKLQNDENCFSDALGYFIDRDRYEWQQILQKICQDNNLGKIIYVKREKDATISKDNKGGRIDLLIRTDNAYIVIENKIKSDINRVQGDSRGKNQLDRYIEYIKHSIEGHAEIKSYFFILAPDYNMPDAEERKGYKTLYYSTLVGKHQKDVDNAGVVEMMKQYNEIHKNENLWSAFYDAMTRHSFDHENDSLYEDMKNTFFTRIQECSKKDNNA